MVDTETILQILAIAAAGFGAGFINVIVGSGTLITFPILLMFGYPALTANISNNVGLVAGNISGVWGYRQEIKNHWGIISKLLPASFIGGLSGALLLLILPSAVFDFVVPLLIALGLILVAIGPVIQGRTAAKIAAEESNGVERRERLSYPLITFLVTLGLGTYGGYFGAAQGVLMVGALGLLLTVSLQALNAMKNMLVAIVNIVSALVFTVFAFDQVNWGLALVIAIGAALGGLVGSKVGRKLPPALFRTIIILVGSIALINMLLP